MDVDLVRRRGADSCSLAAIKPALVGSRAARTAAVESSGCTGDDSARALSALRTRSPAVPAATPGVESAREEPTVTAMEEFGSCACGGLIPESAALADSMLVAAAPVLISLLERREKLSLERIPRLTSMA